MNRTLLRAAASALFLTLACTPDHVAQDSTSSSGTPPITDAPAPEPDPGPAPPSAPGSGGTACQVDADCDAGTFCELRICVVGCDNAEACGAGEVCDPHGRCTAADDDAAALAGLPALTERRTVLAPGETEARVTLRNDGPGVLTYRLAAHHPALTLDPAPAELAPGAEAQLVALVDLAALAPGDLVLPVQILTSGGGILWSIEPAAPLQAGYFRGAVSFSAGSFGLGTSDLAVDLDFRADGTIAGRVGRDPQQLARRSAT